MYPYKQHAVHFPTEEDYLDQLEYGSVIIPSMQRFMTDPNPLRDGMLHANIPLHSPYERYPVQQWPSSGCFRNASPGCTSSGNTSQNTQDELRSPSMYHAVPFTAQMNHSHLSFQYPAAEQFQSGAYSVEAPMLPSNCTTLREIEYEPPVSETIMEEVDDVDTKQEAASDHEHSVVKEKETPDYRAYADSAIGHSVRDAQSVEPVDFAEEPASDSDWSPSSSRRKRRRSTASSSSASRPSKRRGHARKDSQATSPTASIKCEKKTQRTSKTSKNSTDAAIPSSSHRPFPCPLAAYGCKSDFASKNEWKRHVSTQHIKLGFWRCDLCPPSIDPNDEDAFYHNDFNRKDLFTQHLRRMHAAPKDSKSTAHTQKEWPVSEANLPEHQTRCNRWLRDPPQESGCLFCTAKFTGRNSWDERMEHVGRHLEKDYRGCRGMLDVAAWREDEGLERYLLDEGLAVREGQGWRIGDGVPRRGGGGVKEEDDDEDKE